MEINILKILSVFSGLLPIILFLVFFRRNKERKLWVIFLYTIVSLITDLAFVSLTKKEEFFLFSSFTIIEYSIFTAFFFLQIKSRLIKYFIVGSSVLFFAFAIYNMINTQNYNFDSLPASIESVLVILFCIFFFFEEMRSSEVAFIYATKVFWVATAVIIYLAANLFLFISANYFSMEERDTYWSINFISNILKNILLSIAFILPKHKAPPPSDRDLYNKAFAPPFN